MPKNNAIYYQDGGKRRKFSQRGGIGIWSNPYEGMSGSDLNAQLWQEYHQRGGKKRINKKRNLLNTLLRAYDAKNRQRRSTFKMRRKRQ